MRITTHDPSLRRTILETLVKVPPDVRAFALSRCVFVGVGPTAHGLVLGVAAPAGPGGWVVALAGGATPAVIAHEIAHAVSGHADSSREAEEVAAGLAASWGFDGPAADPEVAVELFDNASARKGSWRGRARADDELVVVHCSCGSECDVLAPAVPGLLVELGTYCLRCDTVGLLDGGQLLACPTCRASALDATWAPEATPDAPVATWRCGCGGVTSRRLKVHGAQPEPLPEGVWAASTAASLLMDIEERLLRVRVEDELDDMAKSSMLVSVSLAIQRAQQAGRAFGEGPQGSMAVAAAAEVAELFADLRLGDYVVAAGRAGRAARALNQLVGEQEAAPDHAG